MLTKLFGISVQFVGCLLKCCHLFFYLVDLVKIGLQAGI